MAQIKGIKNIGVNQLKPYENNSKVHSQSQIEKIGESIKEFGFLSPILIDADKNVIAGHGRLEASKYIGLDTVPCISIEGLTEEQRKAYIIADNKLSEFGKWDKDLLANELSILDINDFNVDLTGFDISSINNLSLGNIKPYGAERQRTMDAYNLGMLENNNNDYWQMPLIKKQDIIPTELIGFNYAKTSKNKNCGIHFFVDDYQFERIWNYPDKYVEILKEYECVLSPEFSLYWDMPLPMKIWNTYRNRFIGAYLQEQGINVIPTICWADENTFDFAFLGVEKGTIVAVETNGAKNEEVRPRWYAGMDELIQRIEPSKILLYGGNVGYDFGDIEVIEYDNKVLSRWKNET